MNGTLFFSADDGASGAELWRSDGTAAGTVLVKDINRAMSSAPTSLKGVNGTLYFAAGDGVNGYELWKSDGTAAGTVLVRDIRPGSGSSFPSALIELNGMLLLRADDGVNGGELWKSDGTSAGTVLVKNIDGVGASSTPSLPTDVGGTLFFRANDGVHGVELWKSDGTEAGTVLVKDILTGSPSSNPSSLIDGGGTLFFVAGQSGNELWRSDGTDAGTVLVKSFLPISGTSNIPSLTNVGGTIFFPAIDGVTFDRKLWKTDGTAAGTVLVKEWPFTGNLFFGGIAFKGNYVFEVNDSIHGREPWKSDGTTAGTVLLKDINPGSAPSIPNYMTDADGTLFFSADDGTNGSELWKSDGTEAGTVLVEDIAPGGGASILIFAKVGATVYFSANDTVHSFELWKSDGTAPGTVMVKDINIGSSASITEMANVGGRIFLVANDGIHGHEPWKTDGTEAGTVLVKDIAPGSGLSFPLYLTNVGGTLFLSANDGTVGAELWRSDGTEAGTLMVHDISAGGASSSPAALAVAGSRLFFAADDGATGAELWALATQAVDLSVTNSDGQATAVAGLPVEYTITVANAGPAAVVDAIVTNPVPAALLGATWTCTASAASTCTPSGSGGISDTVDLAPGGTLTYRLAGTVDPSATGSLTSSAAISASGGITDPNPANNSATDTDTLTWQADLAITVTDGQTSATPGAPLTYTITVTQGGPSSASQALVRDMFPTVLGGVTWTCAVSSGSSCSPPAALGHILALVDLLPGGTATFTADAVLSPSATGILANTASVTAPSGLVDPEPGNNAATDVDNVSLDIDELAHGHKMVRSLAALPGPVARVERFWLSQSPRASYEVVVDATSGDVGPGVVLERVGPDGTTVLQGAQPVSGLGSSRSLRWVNALPVSVDNEFVQVRSAQCTTDCGVDDVYRVRAYETTYAIPRFNNAGSQVTVLILQNPTSEIIAGAVHFWGAGGTLLASQPFTLAARVQLVLNTATLPALNGLSGTITVTSNGRYGELVGKAVALEPLTGFSFDSPMTPRPR